MAQWAPAQAGLRLELGRSQVASAQQQEECHLLEQCRGLDKAVVQLTEFVRQNQASLSHILLAEQKAWWVSERGLRWGRWERPCSPDPNVLSLARGPAGCPGAEKLPFSGGLPSLPQPVPRGGALSGSGGLSSVSVVPVMTLILSLGPPGRF